MQTSRWNPLLLIASLSAVFITSAIGQDKDCFKVKGLEFFAVGDVGRVRWSESEINTLINKVDPAGMTYFVPTIIRQAGEYHPECAVLKEDNRFHLLMRLYTKIRPNVTFNTGASTADKLGMMRADFYRQVNNDRLLPGLIYSMDDGPLAGETVGPRLGKPLASAETTTAFGKVRISNHPDRVVAAGTDKNGKLLWSRILMGTRPKRYLKAADLDAVTANEIEFVTAVSVNVDGKKLTIYSRPDGRFLYYTHSW